MNAKAPTDQRQPDSDAKNAVVATGSLALRLPYPKSIGEYAGIDVRGWQVLTEAIFPAAQTVEAICMAVAYCRERKLDIMKRPIHIVPVYSTKLKKYVETIWPGISEIRTTASRTGDYAGKDAAAFGPTIEHTFKHEPKNSRNSDDEKAEEFTLKFPEFCQITVYKMVHSARCAFVGPKVFWLEAYASKSFSSEIPNSMWAERAFGQIEKCAEAAALRSAFPEEIGNEYAAEEMHGRVIDGHNSIMAPSGNDPVTPPRPNRSDFERKDEPTAKPVETVEAEVVSNAASAEPEEQPITHGGDQSVIEEEGAANPNTAAWQAFKNAAAEKLTETKLLKEVAAVRDNFAPEFADDPADKAWWEKLCDARGKAVMEERIAATNSGTKKK